MPFVGLSSSDMIFHYRTSTGKDPSSFDPAKENILFLHPGLVNVEYFDAQFNDPRLSNVYNMIAFDARAHGLTVGTPILDVTMERKARCLLEGLDKIGLGDKQVHIYGESFCGTTVAIYLSLLRPRLVKSMILCSPMNYEESEPNLSIYTNMLSLMTANKEGEGDQSETFPASVVSAWQNVMQGDHISEAQKTKLAQKFIARYGKGHTAEECIELLNPLIVRRPIPETLLEEITCPVLILHGTEDQAATLEASRTLQKQLLNVPGEAKLVEVYGAPHYLSLCVPNIIARFILRFLDMQKGK